MSLYDQASLVMIPSGYKAGKLYSAKPTDGAGDLSFTRTGATATRVNESGLIEACRTNKLTFSEDFTSARSWIADGGTITATGNYGTAPNGTNTSTRLVFGGSNRSWYKIISGLTGSFGVFSLYIKGTPGETIVINYAGIDKIITLGTGWNRVSTNGNLGSDNLIQITTYAGVTARDFEVWGGQVEDGDIATAYIPTTSAAVTVGPIANVPRLDYTGGGCPKLLMEPTRTNLVTYSQQINNAAWEKLYSGSATIPSVTANYATSPDGYQNADRVQFSRTGNTASDYSLLDRSTSSTGGASVVSFYAKSLSGTKNLLMYYGGVGQVFQVTTEWQRFSLYSPTSNTDLTIGTRGGSGLYFTGGDQSIDILLWGVQKEAGSYATSYIPTFNASVTRNADNATKASATALIGQTEGTIYFEGIVSDFASTNFGVWGVQNAATSSHIHIASGNNDLFVQSYNGTTSLFFTTLSYTKGTLVKIALAYKAGDYAVYKNGTLILSGTNATAVPICDRIETNRLWLSPGDQRELINQGLIFKTRLSNTDLATLTTI